MIDHNQVRIAYTNGQGKISEPKIAQAVIQAFGMVSLHGVPYNADGEIDESQIVRSIANLLVELGVDSGTANKAEAIKRLAIQLSAEESMAVDRNIIPVANGTLSVNNDGSFIFSPEKRPAPYRLACRFDPNATDLTWFNYWKNILYEDDWDCFQEIMGYFLLPVTYGQYAFFLLGEGGCGKSVWGCILRSIFGNAMTSAETHSIEEDRFTRATLENKLVNYDDDLDGSKMRKTNLFKCLVTAKQPIQAERKGVDKFEFLPYARLCGCGNSSLMSMFDTSDAFIRRLLLIKVKPPIGKNNVIPDIEEKIYPESSAILNWALDGLKRLIKNNYQFSLSERTMELVQQIREESNSIIPFIDDEIEFHPIYCVGSEALVAAYNRYCSRMDYVPRGSKTLSGYFKNNAERLNIQYTNKIPKFRTRGFVGMKLKSDKTQKKPTLNLSSILKEG